MVLVLAVALVFCGCLGAESAVAPADSVWKTISGDLQPLLRDVDGPIVNPELSLKIDDMGIINRVPRSANLSSDSKTSAGDWRSRYDQLVQAHRRHHPDASTNEEVVLAVPVVASPKPLDPGLIHTSQRSYCWTHVEKMALVIYQEVGSMWIPEEACFYVGDTLLNRVDDPRFPDNLHDVITSPHQFGMLWKTGIVWPERSKRPTEQKAVSRAYNVAERILMKGEHSSLYGRGYVWFAKFRQGRDHVYAADMYFGR